MLILFQNSFQWVHYCESHLFLWKKKQNYCLRNHIWGQKKRQEKTSFFSCFVIPTKKFFACLFFFLVLNKLQFKDDDVVNDDDNNVNDLLMTFLKWQNKKPNLIHICLTRWIFHLKKIFLLESVKQRQRIWPNKQLINTGTKKIFGLVMG